MNVKKIALVLSVVLLAASFAGCKRKITKYSFGPKENISSMSAEYKESLTAQLNRAGKAPDGLSFYGYSAKYNDEGGLEIDGFFRNNTGKPVHNISGTISIESIGADGKNYLTIAKAKFTFPDEDFGLLPNREARPWKLIFNSDLIVNKLNNLSSYMVNADLTFDTESSLGAQNTAAE